MYLFPKFEFLTYFPKVSPMSRVRPLNSQLKMLISATLGWKLDTLNPFWSIKGPKGSRQPRGAVLLASQVVRSLAECCRPYVWGGDCQGIAQG